MKRPQTVLLILMLTLFVLITVFIFYSNGLQDKLDSKNIAKSATIEQSKELFTPSVPSKLRLNTLSVGDIYLGRGVNKWSNESDLKFAYPFSGLESLEKDKYDAWIANLECPVTKEQVTSYQEAKLLKFSCRPEYVPELAKWFEAVSLANNHTDNMQEVNGFAQTRGYLEESSIQYFGHFDNAFKEDICEVVSFKASAIYEDEEIETSGDYYIPMALCGYHNLYKVPTDAEIAVIQEYSKYFITIVMPHQGVEYVHEPDGLKTTVFRKMIDNGADFVVGGHPHAVQNSEAYKGKLIMYSVGNFIFDQQFSYDVMTGIALNLDFTFDYNENMKAWKDVAESCKEFKDECLSFAKKNNLTKPLFNVRVDIIATSSANKLTKKGSEADQKAMLERTGFQNTLKDLNY